MKALTEHVKYIASDYRPGRKIIPDPFVALVSTKPDRGKDYAITLFALTRYMMLRYTSTRRSYHKEIASITGYVARKAGELTDGIAMTPPLHMTADDFKQRFDVVEQIDLKSSEMLKITKWLVDAEIERGTSGLLSRGPNNERKVSYVFCGENGNAYTAQKSMVDIAYETVCDNSFRRCNFYRASGRDLLIVTETTKQGDYFVTSLSNFDVCGCNVCQ